MTSPSDYLPAVDVVKLRERFPHQPVAVLRAAYDATAEIPDIRSPIAVLLGSTGQEKVDRAAATIAAREAATHRRDNDGHRCDVCDRTPDVCRLLSSSQPAPHAYRPRDHARGSGPTLHARLAMRAELRRHPSAGDTAWLALRELTENSPDPIRLHYLATLGTLERPPSTDSPSHTMKAHHTPPLEATG